MTQTAVKFLIDMISYTSRDTYSAMVNSGFLEQALQMEKEQIIDAFGVGCHHESKRLVGYQDTAEQYYNETYGGKQ